MRFDNPIRGHARLHGYTLVEVMLALGIVATLVAVALPTYTDQQSSARRREAQAAMVGFAQAMEQHYSLNFTYLKAAAGDLDTGAPDEDLYPSSWPASGDPYYTLTIEEATANSFRLRATPVSGKTQAGDGLLEINSLGQRFWDRNNDNDTSDTGENSWDD